MYCKSVVFGFGGTVEPAQRHVGIGTGGDELHRAARFQSLLQVERTNAVGVVAESTAAPQSATDFPRLAARVVRLRAEAEVVHADLFAIFKRDAIARAGPLRVFGEILSLAVELHVVENHRDCAAGLHHVLHAEPVKCRALLFVQPKVSTGPQTLATLVKSGRTKPS